MDVAFASWLDQCPDKVRFVLQYNDLRSDIANVIETFGYEFASIEVEKEVTNNCLLYTSPSPRDATLSRMPSSA